ncbi:MAG: DUF4373 domain-containing protein [Bacteroides sp.]|nr:DUF4373 domain-containing protein [Bacteroides sp.]
MNNLTFIKHSAAAKSDPRLSVLIDKEGLKGYGLYWMLMECLAHAPRLTASMEVLRVLKKQHRLSADLLQRVLENYGLFVVKIGKRGFYTSIFHFTYRFGLYFMRHRQEVQHKSINSCFSDV